MASGDTSAAIFPPSSEASWRALVDKVLKGRAFETLVATTPEGVRIAPLYPRATTDGPRAIRQQPGPWHISQRIDHPDAADANRAALADLENGADALTLVIAGAAAGRGFGVAIDQPGDLATTLAGVELDLIDLRLDAGPRALELAHMLAGLSRDRRLTAAALDIDIGHDPIGGLARSGRGAAADEIGREAAAAGKALRQAGLDGAVLLADGRPYHEAGAGDAQELAAVLATGVQYLRLLEAAGTPLEAAAADIAFLLVADADEFVGIAKFRALRRLWARVEAACGLPPRPIRLHAETAWRMMTARDPWVNILRTTMAVFAAGLGGADAIATLPFTLALGLPDELARRIARNGQTILLNESHLGHVIDPAAGAGGFEALTDALCDAAWAFFQNIEAAGGMIAALDAGLPQGRIAAVAAGRRADVAHRRLAMTGTSAFPHLAEAAVAVLAPAPRPAPQPGGLPSMRDSTPFEALRDRADAATAAQGRPSVFLASLGDAAAFTPRATMARNFFAAAGIDATSTTGFAAAAAAADAYKGSGAALACLCGTDEVYSELASAAIRGVKAAGARRVYLTGRPGESEHSLRDAGLDGFIFDGCDALAILDDAVTASSADV